MFGFGDSGEDELEGNLQDIKQMVERDDGEQEDSTEETAENDVDEGVDSFEQKLEEAEDQAEKVDWHGNGADDTHGSPAAGDALDTDQGFSGEGESRPTPPGTGEGTGATPEHGEENEQRGQERKNARDSRTSRSRSQGPGDVSRLDSQIPEPARTRQLDVPEIDKGPLFIRRRKFERAAQLIQDMKYLTEQVEATVNTIEEDIQRAQDTEQEVRQLIDDFESGRSEVEDIVSPDSS